MSSEVKIRSADFMESENKNESLESRIREVEDENEVLRAQNLFQSRRMREQRNELLLLRFQMSELADMNVLLRARVRTLVQNIQQQENERGAGPVTAPPLMSPSSIPPPPFPPRIRVNSRQVGAGEALTPPLGISQFSPSRQRIKRNCRQGLYRSNRNLNRRLESPEPGPSSQAPFSPERPNYFLRLKVPAQFHSFLCNTAQLSSYHECASDSSGSDETSGEMLIKPKSKCPDLEPTPKKPVSFSKDPEFLKKDQNFRHQKARQSVLQNYDLSLPNTGSKFLVPLSWDRNSTGNPAMPSTSGNEIRPFVISTPSTSGNTGLRNSTKISDCVQYTFPKIHEGLHYTGIKPIVSNGGQSSMLKKLKKNIPYSSPATENSEEVKKDQENGTGTMFGGEENQKNTETGGGIDSESLYSFDDTRVANRTRLREMPSDLEQDGFQADESSNCLTSTDNSLEKISLNEFNTEKKN